MPQYQFSVHHLRDCSPAQLAPVLTQTYHAVSFIATYKDTPISTIHLIMTLQVHTQIYASTMALSEAQSQTIANI